MAQIQLKIGALTSTKTATDADATKIFGLVFDANAPKFDASTTPPTPIVYTAQQQLDFVLGVIVSRLITEAKATDARNQRQALEAAINEGAGTIKL